ncbi:hypothetical protein AMTR_s00016p00045350 [Amborella trichopoda]|uniref:Neprosin PEP catalytic domain-containing protein n=1 Tax=Amborella trichopoda TaxID=13333 RepID=W1PEH7_AMBTC|nr:hypothetical protein AMTR_s00016p00045350 [Amborella trichopoda]
MYAKGRLLYGASQYSTVWNPQLESPSEYSAAGTWLVNNEGSETNLVGAGWMVKPSLFGDNQTRLFVAWDKVAGSQTTGCYNLLCPGFIQTNSKVVLGGVLTPVSVIGGKVYYIHYNIFKWLWRKGKNSIMKLTDGFLYKAKYSIMSTIQPLFGTIMNRSSVKYLRITLHLQCPSITISSGCPMVSAIAFKAYVL